MAESPEWVCLELHISSEMFRPRLFVSYQVKVMSLAVDTKQRMVQELAIQPGPGEHGGRQKVAKKLEDYDDDNLESLAKIRPHIIALHSPFVPSFLRSLVGSVIGAFCGGKRTKLTGRLSSR